MAESLIPSSKITRPRRSTAADMTPLTETHSAGWSDDHINEQRTFTDGRIFVTGNRTIRRKQKRADYLCDTALILQSPSLKRKRITRSLQMAWDRRRLRRRHKVAGAVVHVFCRSCLPDS